MNLTQEEITAVLNKERQNPTGLRDNEMVPVISENPLFKKFSDAAVELIAEKLLNGGFRLMVAASMEGAVYLGYLIGLAEAEKREQSKNATVASAGK